MCELQRQVVPDAVNEIRMHRSAKGKAVDSKVVLALNRAGDRAGGREGRHGNDDLESGCVEMAVGSRDGGGFVFGEKVELEGKKLSGAERK